MSDQFETTGTQHIRGFLRAFVRSDQADDDFPVARAAFDIRPTRQGRDRYAAITHAAADKREAVEREVQREIDEAIERRVAT